MQRLPSTLLLLAAAIGGALRAQDVPARQTPLAPILQGSPEHGIPGAQAGTERWLVTFETRSFDLTGVRAAILAHRPAAEVDQLLAAIQQRMVADQKDFVAAVQQLGGRVAQQFWLVNGAAIEIPPERLAAVRALPGVRLVQPDQLCKPTILRSTNGGNHDADQVQAWGYKGQGATVGIIDTGQDSNVSNSFRPHRTYFIDGNPGNLTGGGMAGSRLLANRQVGAMGADDVAGHGTSVASVAAGENWGMAQADRGHAPRAGIAGYSIANFLNGDSNLGTMAVAWQFLSLDRQAMNIVAANLSYSGSPNPLSFEQQAMDSVALNFDVTYCVSAGNLGPNTNSSQAAVNGLAVGAVAHDTHVVAQFSAQGPLAGDPTRFYPDLSACGVSVDTAARDFENTFSTASGTSFASPQVAGAATQLRARFPWLTAVQTKAILLASSRDLAAQNPGMTRNDYGMGLLRNERAHLLAAGNDFGSAVVTTGAPHAVTIPVVQGHTYSIAIAWFRQNVGDANWSNLDLTVKNASTQAVLATATSPRNLYEMVRVTPTFTGSLLLETTATSLGGTFGQPQPFSWACADSTRPTRDVVAYGTGCTGQGQPFATCNSLNASGATLLVGQPIAGNEHAWLIPSSAQTFDGVEILASSSLDAATALVYIRQQSGMGDPAPFPLATSRLTAGSAPGYCRALFPAPVTVTGNYYVCLESPQLPIDVQLTSGVPTQALYRQPFGIWQPAPFLGPVSIRIVCRTTAVGATPHYRIEGENQGGFPLPPLVFGTTSQRQLSEARPNSFALFCLGFTETNLPLGPLGAPGCTQWMSAEFVHGTLVNAAGEATSPLTLPLVLDAHYLEIYSQCAVLDPSNPLGAVVSNGLRLTIGP